MLRHARQYYWASGKSHFTDSFPISGEATKYILEEDITVYFYDTDEYFLALPETVKVFKMRETWNFDFEKHVWLYSNKTGRNING